MSLTIDHSRQENGREKRQEQLARWDESQTATSKNDFYRIFMNNSQYLMTELLIAEARARSSSGQEQFSSQPVRPATTKKSRPF